MMPPKWYEYAQRCTSPDEHLGRNYDGQLDGDYGHLFISDKKLIFVKEEGFLRKKYSVPLTLKYDDIQDIRSIDRNHLQISEKTGKTHEFESDINVSIINKAIHEEMNSSVLVPM